MTVGANFCCNDIITICHFLSAFFPNTRVSQMNSKEISNNFQKRVKGCIALGFLESSLGVAVIFSW